jgi:hypothetical protein
MNGLELIMMGVSAIALYGLFCWCLKNKKAAVLPAVMMLPGLFVALQGATQMVTIDEPPYINAFSNMQNSAVLLNVGWGSRSLYQYRTTQLFLGSLFNMLRGFGFAVDNAQGFQDIFLFQIYKAAHWFLCAAFLAAIIYVVWKWYMPPCIKDRKYVSPLALGFLGLFLLTLPVNALMIKVANYDGTHTYPCVLAILLAVVWANHGDRKVALASILAAYLGAIEKIQAAPYVLIALTLIVFGVLCHSEHLKPAKRVVWALLIWTGILSALFLLSTLDLARILSYQPSDDLAAIGAEFSFSLVVFPFGYIFKAAYTGSLGGENFDIGRPWAVAFCAWVAVFAAALALYGICKAVERKSRQSNVGTAPYGLSYLPKVLGVSLLIFLAVTIYGAYAIPGIHANVAAKLPAKTIVEYKISQLIGTYSGNGTSLPTSVLLLTFVLAVLLLRRNQKNALPRHIILLLLGCLFLPLLLTVAGQSGGARYYGAQLNLYLIGVFVSLPSLIDWDKALAHSRRLLAGYGALCLLLVLELSLYAPNGRAFSPIWLVRGQALSAAPQYGYMWAGEPIMWGDNVFVSVKLIDGYYRKQGMSNKTYTLYSDYYGRALGSQHVQHLYKGDITERHFTADTWIAITRYALYGHPIPGFLSEVEPIMKFKYKGMTAIWIYRGDQLTDYIDYFLNPEYHS